MKVALNLEAASWLGGRYYLENLALALGAAAPDVELVTIGPEDRRFPLLPHSDRLPADVDVIFPNWGLPARTTARQVHWIPDLQHRALRENFGRLERLRRDYGYRRLGRPAALVVVSSDVARSEAAAAYPRLERKLRVLHFATAAPPAPPADDLLARYSLPDEFVLLPNQFWAHKNHETAFAALAELPLPLVCTGATEDHRHPGHFERLLDTVRARGLESRVTILGVVPRRDYLGLVGAATAVLQPSLFEGWSSVVEDARSYGRPLALSDIPVHREQAPPLASYFPPRDPAALSDAVATAVATQPLPRQEAEHRQQARVAAFARRFVEVATEAAASGRSGDAE